MSHRSAEERPLELAPLPLAKGLRARVLASARAEAEVAARLARGERLARLARLYERWLEPAGALLLGLLQLGSALALVLR